MSEPASQTSQTGASRLSSRRVLLGTGLGALAATVASALTRQMPVRAADGDDIRVGSDVSGTLTTKVTCTTNGYSAFWGNASGGGDSVGVRGDSAGGTGGAGVWGNTTSLATGVLGTGGSGRGVAGTSSSNSGVYGSSNSGRGVSGVSLSNSGVHGESTDGFGVHGDSISDIGVVGTSASSIGVRGYNTAATEPATVGWAGNNSTGLLGYSGGGPFPATKAKTGVYGEATQDSDSRGVWGQANAGQGVRGAATSGVGVYGTATSGFAFRGDGRLRFDKVSGVATIGAGKTSVTVTPGVDVTADSFVLLTPMANLGSRGLWFTKDATNDKFTIRISSSRTSSTMIGWLLLR